MSSISAQNSQGWGRGADMGAMYRAVKQCSEYRARLAARNDAPVRFEATPDRPESGVLAPYPSSL